MSSQDLSRHSRLDDYLRLKRGIPRNKRSVILGPEQSLDTESLELKLVDHLPVPATEKNREEVLVVLAFCYGHELPV